MPAPPPPDPAATLRLRLLGAPQVEFVATGRPEVRALPFERRGQLAAWLALRRTWTARSELATLLWPDQESKLAFTNLRKALHRLQALPWAAALEAQGQALRLAVRTDVAEFEAALAAGHLDDALALFRGELLEGFEDDGNAAWSERLAFERERLHAAWRAAALARLEQEEVDPGAAVALAARLAAADPLDEAALAAQMRALARSGQLTGARAAYRAYEKRLQDELGIAPGAVLAAQHGALGQAGAEAAAAVPGSRAQPPARSDGSGRASDDTFIGRTGELKRIADLLAQADCPALCLVGPGGVGKTRLAQRAMQALAGSYADGGAFVPLEDVPSQAEVGARLAGTLGITPGSTAGNTPGVSGKGHTVLDDVLRSLAPRQMLLVLDNFEHLAADSAWLDDVARACPGVKLLLTSRVRPLAKSTWTLPLEGLPCPEPEDEDRLEAFDAARLFVRAAQRVEPALLPGAEAAAIVEICRLVEGLPLALELAATFTRVLSCQAIAAELREGTELLRTADPARPARQASMEVVFEQSWRHLAPVERQALARLAIFHGGFTAAAARSVAGASLPVLAALSDKSLLHKDSGPGGGRCHLHPLVQQFAWQRLEGLGAGGDGSGSDPAARASSEHRTIAAAHSRHYLRNLAAAREALGLAERAAMLETELEFENLRAAWRWAAAEGPGAELRRAAPALMAFCDHRGRWEEGVRLLREALQGPVAASSASDGDGARLASTLGATAAHLEHRLDRYAEAEALARQALGLAQRGRDTAAELQCTKVLAATCLRLSRLVQAQHWYERTLALAEDLADARSVAGTLDNLSLLERLLGHHDKALDLSRRALLQHRALADSAGEALCLNNQGVLHVQRGDLEAAQEALLAARQLCERHGLPTTRSLVEVNLADLARKRGDFEAMARHAESALELSRNYAQRANTAVAHQLLMFAALQRNDVAQARRELAAALEIALAVGRPALKVNGIYLFAELLAAQGEHDCAVRVMDFALSHPILEGGDREAGEASIRRWGGRRGTPWSGPELDPLVQRIVLEAELAYRPLLTELRRGTA